MSSRRMACRFPSASISSTEVVDSDASRPLITPPVGGGDRILHEVALDAPAGVEDVNQQLAARNGRHTGEVGADLAPFAIVAVALGALLLEDQLAPRGISPLLELGARADRSRAADRGREGRRHGQQLFGTRGDLAIGMGRQGLFLIECQLGEPGRVVLEPVDEGRNPVGTAEQDPQDPRAHAGRELGQDGDERLAHRGALLVGDGVDKPARQARATIGRRDQFQEPVRAPCVAWHAARSTAARRRCDADLATCSSLTEASSDAAISAPSRSRAWSPQAPARRTSGPAPPGSTRPSAS